MQYICLAFLMIFVYKYWDMVGENFFLFAHRDKHLLYNTKESSKYFIILSKLNKHTLATILKSFGYNSGN